MSGAREGRLHLFDAPSWEAYRAWACRAAAAAGARAPPPPPPAVGWGWGRLPGSAALDARRHRPSWPPRAVGARALAVRREVRGARELAWVAADDNC